MAIEHDQIATATIAAVEFPDLVQRYAVTGVPKIVVNDRIEILGAQPEPEFVPRVLAALNGDSASSSSE